MCSFLERLGARDLFVDAKESDHVSVGLADDAVGDMDAEFESWVQKLISQYKAFPKAPSDSLKKEVTINLPKRKS